MLVKGIFVMSALFTAQLSNARCYDDEEKVYKKYESPESWTRALAMCTYRGGTLASFLTSDEFEKMQETTGGDCGSYWIGAACEGYCFETGIKGRDEFYWISTETQVDQKQMRFGENQPDLNCLTGTGKCRSEQGYRIAERVALLKDGELHDRCYIEDHPYICEFCQKNEQYSEPC